MNPTLPQLVEAFAGQRVLVLGEAMLDGYLQGAVDRFCPEAPVPVVALRERRDVAGGAANTAVNVHCLGGQVDFLSVVGEDAEGERLRHTLTERGLSTEHVLVQPGRRTLAKCRILAASQLLLRFDQGSTEPVAPEIEQALLDRLVSLYAQCDALVLSDYTYGVLTPRLIRALADLQARWSRVLVADSRRLALLREVGLTACKPNYEQATQLLGAGVLEQCRVRAEGIVPHGERLLDLTGAQIVAVTLDTDGAVVFERGRPPYRTYAQAARRAFVAGAGDTYTASLALALAAGAPTAAAAELASAASAVVVGKERTATCSAQELRDFVAADGKYVPDLARLAVRVQAYKEQGRKVVFTNGCFDILHRGHITYLHQAKKLGDVLIVGVNADNGIRRLKGPGRPINTLDDRLQVLAALGCIDHLIAFAEDTPCNLIRGLKPDVFVKGGDYTRAGLPEAPLVEQFGGMVQILPLLPNRSTTRIIERIAGARDDEPLAVTREDP